MTMEIWTLERIRLPKQAELHPEVEHLRARLRDAATPLWREDSLRVPRLPMTPALLGALRDAASSKAMVRGLEEAERVLASEQRGQDIADQRSGEARGARLSRLLVLADDGSERFYRQVERLLSRHGARLLAIRVEIDGASFGTELMGVETPLRAVLLNHKDAVSSVLLSLL